MVGRAAAGFVPGYRPRMNAAVCGSGACGRWYRPLPSNSIQGVPQHGTNHRDDAAALGFSRKLAAEMSDGVVQIDNATVSGAPRAFACRSHSGNYGVVNSEDGYQNLVRFLFGDVRVDGTLEVAALSLSASVKKARNNKQIRASCCFEATVVPRGANGFKLTVSTTGYTSDNKLWLDSRVEGEYLFSDSR